MNKLKLYQLINVVFISTLLIGCDEGIIEDNDTEGRPVYSVRDMVGVWDETYIASNGLRNTTFTDIKSDGTFYVYDYMGDSYDTNRIGVAKDCYSKKGPYQFIRQYQNTYKDTLIPNTYKVFKLNNYVLSFEIHTNEEAMYNYAYKINTKISSLNLCS